MKSEKKIQHEYQKKRGLKNIPPSCFFAHVQFISVTSSEEFKTLNHQPQVQNCNLMIIYDNKFMKIALNYKKEWDFIYNLKKNNFNDLKQYSILGIL